MFINKAKYLLYILPILPLIFGFKYQDPFYFFISFCIFGIVYFFLHPKLFNKKLAISHHHSKNKHKPDVKSIFQSVTHIRKIAHFDKRNPLIIGSIILFLSFIYIGVSKLINVPEKNIYLKYLISLEKYISTQGGWLIILSFIFWLSIVVYNRKNNASLIKNILNSSLMTIISLFLIVNVSLIGTYIFSIGELNAMVIKSRFGSIVTGKSAVADKLKKYKKAPQIIGKDYKIDNTVIYKAFRINAQRGSFYEVSVIGSLPKIVTFLFSLPKDNLVLFGNYLQIREINRQEIQDVTGTLVKTLIQDALSSKYIKDEPKYEVIGRQDYLKYRENQINKDIKKVEVYIESEESKIDEANSYLSKAYAGIKSNNDAINNARDKISANEAAINSANSTKNSDYISCINAGYFFYGTFIHSHSQSYCDSMASITNGYIAQYQQNIKDWNDSINEYQNNLSEWNQAVSLIKTRIAEIQDGIKLLQGYKSLLEAKKSSTVYELGVFIPEKDIKLALDDVSSKSLADYLATAVHEYLHYTSYVSEEKSNNFDPFFEEALTEYFARNIIKDELNISTAQGYPLFTRIVAEMTKKVKDKDLLEVYLTKNQDGLQALLDNAYGKDFYKNTQSYFIQLYYSAADNELKIANNIMFRIGGKEIKEKDQYSSPSELK